MTKPTMWMCAQRRIRSALASPQSDHSSLCAQWEATNPRFLHADSKDSDQTGRMPRLSWVFAGRTDHFVLLFFGVFFFFFFFSFFFFFFLSWGGSLIYSTCNIGEILLKKVLSYVFFFFFFFSILLYVVKWSYFRNKLYIILRKEIATIGLGFVTGRPCGSVTQCSECSHGMREVLGSSPGWAMCFFLPCDILAPNVGIVWYLFPRDDGWVWSEYNNVLVESFHNADSKYLSLMSAFGTDATGPWYTGFSHIPMHKRSSHLYVYTMSAKSTPHRCPTFDVMSFQIIGWTSVFYVCDVDLHNNGSKFQTSVIALLFVDKISGVGMRFLR